jgi:hypothetical protein
MTQNFLKMHVHYFTQVLGFFAVSQDKQVNITSKSISQRNFER